MTAEKTGLHSPVVDTARSPHARLRPVAVSRVALDGEFWGPRCERVATDSLPAQWAQLARTGRLDNFRRVTGVVKLPHQGLVFDDSDLYKWIEAASWCLSRRPDARLERLVGEGIALVEAAQQADGYVSTLYAVERAAERWTDLRDNHELYCAGHLIQAAVAHRRATGSDRLLRVARRFADLVCETFGPAGSGRRPGVDGHQEVELALIELYRETGESRYLEQARHFVEARGHGLLAGGRWGREYFQDHVPFRELDRMTGHAVRALYYNAGVTDLYLETGDASLLETLSRLWTRMVARQSYVSGGLGARHDGESFGKDYELPNAQAYTETCAAVGCIMWCHRMLAATGEARFADVLEWTLFNGLLPGWSLGGTEYFYVNPLEDDGGHRRQPWYTCSCCPPNVARTIASLPGYVYSTRGEDAIFVHLYAQGTARLELPGGRIAGITQRTRYPWSGDVELEIDAEGELVLHLRIPGWCEAGAASLHVNEAAEPLTLAPGSYVGLRRTWHPGDRVRLHLSMPVRFQESHPAVLENTGRVAITRGPLLHCVEGVDHAGVDLREVEVAPRQGLAEDWRPELLGGVMVLRGKARERLPGERWTGRLYRPYQGGQAPSGRDVALTAVPYFAWQNRTPGPMQVWLRASDGT